MKTPREILLERHRGAEPKLDAIRQSMQEPRPETTLITTRFIRELLLPLRWHLTGISAVWLVVALLNAEQDSPSTLLAEHASSSPRQFLLALAENRRQIAEMIEPAAAQLPAAPQPFVPRRRSDARPISAVV